MDGIIADLKSICDLADRARRAGDGRRLARRRLRRRAAAAARRSSAASRAASTSSPERWARRWAARRAATLRARAEIVELLRQRSRPYLFSNTLAPCIAAASLEVLELLQSDEGAALRRRVRANGERFRARDDGAGLRPRAGQHPIIPVMLGRRRARDADGRRAARRRHLRDRLFVSGGAEGQGAHPHADERRAHRRSRSTAAVAAFAKVGKRAGRDPVNRMQPGRTTR